MTTHLLAAHDLTTTLLHFLEEPSKVPETRLGRCSVRGEDGHLVERWHLHLLCRAFSPNDFVLAQLKTETN